ncbi:MAG: Imm42 family immunity protein [Terriglobales bacterium]
MIIGDPSVFAIESSITRAYERLSLRGLGFFVIYVNGRCYGKREPDNTMLACSHDVVEKCIAMRGSHAVPFATQSDAGKIADAFRNAIYAEMRLESYFGIPLSEFSDMIWSRQIVWIPDGDEAFDDGSYVLQFDVQDRVRLIAFKSGPGYLHDAATLSDIWLAADDFYRVLQHWHDAFEVEWASAPKVSAPC